MDESTRPPCFVLMPYGMKTDPAGGPSIDFNRIYDTAISPGVTDASMNPIRADQEELAGTIHKLMFERLLWCPFAVADLTTSNGNVLYELGVRHAVRPRTTLLICAARTQMPFDVRALRAERYELGEANQFPADAAAQLRRTVTERLVALRALERLGDPKDSPLFEFVDGWRPKLPPPAEAFGDRMRASEELKQNLRDIRTEAARGGASKTRAMEGLVRLTRLILDDPLADLPLLVTLMRTYPALDAWQDMVGLYNRLPPEVKDQVVVRQQLAMAYNRLAEAAEAGALGSGAVLRRRAVEVLERLERDQGPTSEACGLLGRIHKAQWREAEAAGNRLLARPYLQAAINAYVRGFETDLRDYYPGVNAVTLLDAEGSQDSLARKERLLPVVEFAVEQAGRQVTRDYWLWATRLELAVLKDAQDDAADQLGEALAVGPEPWQRRSTADNLRLIADARARRDADVAWIRELVAVLDPGRRTREEGEP